MSATYTVTNQPDLRDLFWDTHRHFDRVAKKYKQNDYNCEVRAAWVDFVDAAQKNGDISEALAYRATL